ncbi:MAG: dicarboxylate/amino acid:cation symporter [Spirochaetales bacterium]|nr:dicarboxylate/amino acid:cation symporter [Spirochaetales bacterium]
MKIWVKLLIGIGIGFVIALIIPAGGIDPSVIESIAQIVINIGKYAMFPLVFFSLIISVWELRNEKKLFFLIKKTFLYLIGAAVLLSLIGTVSGIFLPYTKIPGPGPNPATIQAISVLDLFKHEIFPDNLSIIFIRAGFSLFPIIVLAFLVGLNVDYEKQFTRPVIQFADGMSRIMFHINSFFMEIFWIGIIAVSAARFFSIKTIQGIEAYLPFLMTLCIDVILVIAVIYPLILFVITKKRNPYKAIYAALGPALTALMTGDHYISAGMQLHHSRENLLSPRNMSTPVFSLAAVFSRAGTALVVSLSFILLRKTTLGTEIPIIEYFWIFGGSILISLFSGLLSFSFPRTGAYAAIAFLCLTYIDSNMIQDKYLDLTHIAPILICVGVLLDVITSWLTAYIIIQEKHPQQIVDIKRCI